MRIGSLFSGAGGLDMAVEAVFGGEVLWQCEFNRAAAQTLAYRWPDIPNHHDITKIDWAAVQPIDILCGGWPCQPFSLAGKRRGIYDERALWPYVANAIRVLRPEHVVLENVSAVLTSVGEFDRVGSDLAEAGYDFAWTCIRASDVGAPHHRERLFVYASPTDAKGAGSREGLPARGLQIQPGRGDVEASGHAGKDFGPFTAVVHRWEQLTRPAPDPLRYDDREVAYINPQFAEWMMGWPAGWVTDVPGLSTEDQLRIVGNGVCPQQAAAALRFLLSVSQEAPLYA